MAVAVEKIVAASVVERALRMNPQDVVRELVDVLGASLVAVIGHVKNTRTVRHWLQGEKQPEQIDRLRLALQVSLFMQAAGESKDVVNAWMRGMNLRLRDEAPAIVLADAPLEQARHDVMAAARAFLAH
jgi:hypothetical protein